MMIAKLKSPAITLALVLSLAALAACGGAKSPKDREAILRVASSSTLEIDSMRFSMSAAMSGLGNFSGEGFMDLKQGSMSQVITLPATPGVVDQPFRMEQRLIGQIMYMKADGLTDGLPKGKSWIKVDLAALSQELGFDFAELLKSGNTTDPRGPISFLKDTKGEIKELGREKVRGVDTTFYQVTIDMEKALQDLPPDLASAVRPAFEQMAGKDLPVEVWIDEDGLVRRIVFMTPIPDSPSSGVPGGGSVETTMEFFDFGAKDQVMEPAPNEVVDFGALFE